MRKGMTFGSADIHLLGRILDQFDDAVMEDMGFSIEEQQRAEWLFEDIDAFLNDRVGYDWNDMEVG